MKTFVKTLSLLLLTVLTFAATSTTKAAPGSDEARSIEMRFLGRDHVTAGSAITAQLNSTFETQADLIVENTAGKRFVETHFTVDEGSNLVKFRVSEVPAGVYFVKLKTAGKTQTLSFVVQ